MAVEWKKVASTIYSIISLVLNEELSVAKKTVVMRILDGHHRRKIRRYCYEYIKSNNGTVVTNPVFSRYLQNDKTIERLFEYTGCTHVEMTDDEYVDSEIERIKDNLEYPVNSADIVAIEGFLKGLMKEHRCYREKHLSEDTKQIIQNGDKNSIVIEHRLDSQDNKLNEILSIVKGNNNNLSSSEEISIFGVLNTSFWEGDFSLLKTMKPVLHEKSKNLDIWVDIVLDIVMLDGNTRKNLSSLKSIDCQSIRDDAVRKIIIFSYFTDASYTASELSADGELGQVIAKLHAGDAWLFNENSKIENNVVCYTLIPFSSSSKEKETIKKLQIINAFRRDYCGVSNVIDTLAGNDSDFLIDLLKKVKHYTEKLAISKSETEAIALSSGFIKEFWAKKDIYSHTNLYIQRIYWKCILQAFSISDKQQVHEIIKDIPDAVMDDISDCIVLSRIANNEMVKDDIIREWKEKKNCIVLKTYLVTLDSIRARSFLDECIPDAYNFPEVVLTLVALYLRDNNSSDASLLLETYRDICIEYAEYYVNCIQINHKQEDVDELEEKWKHRDLKYINILTDFVIAHVLYDWKKYDTCLSVINALKLKGIDNSEIKKLCGFALINSGKTIEGLAVLNDLIPERQDDVSVVSNILNCSLGLQRDVSDSVINAADKLATPELLLLLGVVYEQRGDNNIAKKYYRKAFLSNKNDKSRIYGVYWAFVMKYFQGDGKVESSNEETYFVAKEKDSFESVTIGILGKEYVEDEQIVEGITLVSIENAIRHGWYSKKVGAEISYKEKAYFVSEIGIIDTCFSRICCSKLVKTGAVKAFSVPQNSTTKQTREYFISFLKENLNDNDGDNEFFRDYKDLSKLPMSLYGLTYCFRTNYIVSVYSMINDPTLMVREWIHYDDNMQIPNTTGYVLSFSALILLFVLQVPVEKLKENKVFIPESMLLEIRNEKNEVISESSREVGRLSFVDDQLHMYTHSEESKQQLMTFVVDLMAYAEKIPTLESKKDFTIDTISEQQLRSLFGMPDLDALSIASEYGYTLVSFEVWLSEINMISGNKTITVIALLSFIESDDTLFVKYLRKLLSCHMMNVLDLASLERIADTKNANADFVKELKCYEKTIDEQDENYRNWLKDHFSHINQLYQEKRNKDKVFSDIERWFFNLLLSLLNREIHMSTGTLQDEEGNVVLRTYLRVFDKQKQKYIDELDRVFDAVFRIDSSSSQGDKTKF